MNEKLLHFIWKFRLFNSANLLTTEGEKLEIVYPGIHNTDAGADFQNAKIKIGKTLWAGNVEIHLKSNDWFLHKHETDKAYDNVILHVVYEKSSKTALRKNGEQIPTLELKGLTNETTLLRYEELAKNKKWIPCEKFFRSVDEFTIVNFLDRLLIERFENKVGQINLLLKQSENDWENVMFQMLARYFGANINKEPFQQLAKSLPVKIWAKHQHDILQLEALVFGQAGFLENKFDDEYPNQLRKEYNYQKRLYNLQPLEKQVWKFLRLRPANFPTVRLAQLMALMKDESKLFSKIKDAKSIKVVRELFDVKVSDYWETHYALDRPSKRVKSQIGLSFKNILLINAISPVLFAYGKYKSDETYCDKALQLLEDCKAETNSIISGWKRLNAVTDNAYQTQALLQLKNEYCDRFRCLECAIGAKILK